MDKMKLIAALTAARTRFSLPESEIAAILAESAADGYPPPIPAVFSVAL